ncbi:RluA family pseudouridine synthase [Enterococcus sp. JM9B]|uniref:RluA family pseudouridine synthase n=1 Tax=Enterococcus sp. JM9B TaxID=1857216 RepID=UPI001374D894|nr:RluA family pseudouridine synthase [Enterococcus sp. JM9B]KAF1303360.1 RNA pseudouridine synthase [Enterococcus sp. JM9B]
MRYEIILPKNQEEQTLRQLLETEWLVPRKVRHFLRVRKTVWVNGNIATFQQMLQAGDRITVELAEEDYSYQEVVLGDKKAIHVLYEDEHLIVVNKGAGLKTHPNQPQETGTLLNDLAAYLADKEQRPYVVHRLDKETSGAILFAKNPLVLPILGRLLEQKKIYRRYQAVVSGKIDHDLTITKKIGRDRHDRRKRVIDERNGQTAITHVSSQQATAKQSRIFCVLETGRTHQIRIHLKSIGHPILGDPLYGKADERLQLHAYELFLTHPFTKEHLQITAEPGLW